VPITPRTVLDIGSTSKQFTAAALGLLVQDGKLAVTDEIHEWVPELAPWDQEVTLDHLLHHTSGLPDYLGLMFRAGVDVADHTTPAQALEHLSKVERLHFEPGARFEYSNSNFFLLSLVIERAAKQPFPVFARERISWRRPARSPTASRSSTRAGCSWTPSRASAASATAARGPATAPS
jgi:CubicO group peptidase (beta-lactamase class C family)